MNKNSIDYVFKKHNIMKNYQVNFKGKKVTMLGLGLLGRGLNDAKFLAECGADLIVTDLKTEEQLKTSLEKLSKFKNIRYVLGEHRLEDFKDRDFILKAAGVPLDSLYIAEARKNNIPIKMDASWFAELSPETKVIGITGTRGKSTTTHLIYHILKTVFGKKVYLGGNIKGVATLPFLKKIKKGDIVVMELDSWQLQGFGESGISSNISVFTNLLSDHLNYYLKGGKTEAEAEQQYFMDKAQIFANQKEGDYLILDKDIKKIIEERYSGSIKSKIILINGISEIKDWKLKIKGEHNLKHILRAIETMKILGISEKKIKKGVESFGGVDGRQQLIREYKGIKIYNDTTATTPDATMVALKSLDDKKNRNLVLIIGGSDKNLNMSGLIKEIPKYCKAVVFLDGTGTTKLLANSLKIKVLKSANANDLKEAVKLALSFCKKGDTLLFSPAYASFGMFKNEFDRGDKFNKIIKNLK